MWNILYPFVGTISRLFIHLQTSTNIIIQAILRFFNMEGGLTHILITWNWLLRLAYYQLDSTSEIKIICNTSLLFKINYNLNEFQIQGKWYNSFTFLIYIQTSFSYKFMTGTSFFPSFTFLQVENCVWIKRQTKFNHQPISLLQGVYVANFN